MLDYILVHPTWDENKEDNAYHFTHIKYPFDLPTLDEDNMYYYLGLPDILDIPVYPEYKMAEIYTLQEYKDIIAKAKFYGEASKSLYATDDELGSTAPYDIKKNNGAKL